MHADLTQKMNRFGRGTYICIYAVLEASCKYAYHIVTLLVNLSYFYSFILDLEKLTRA